MNVRDLHERIESVGSEDELAVLLATLRADPGARDVLAELAASRSVDDRMWVVGYAGAVLGRDASGILDRLSRDRDSDVRMDALTELTRWDRDAALRAYPRIVKSLRSTDFWEPVIALWALATLGDPRAIPEIEAVAATWDPRHGDYRIAEIVVDLLAGRHERIFAAMDEHDHRAMPWLAEAARIIGTPAAREALERCVTADLDGECLHYCRQELTELRSRDRATGAE